MNSELDGKKIIITHQNISNIQVNYYKIDLEVLFSRNPFLLHGNNEDFSFVKPNLIENYAIKTLELEKFTIQLPEIFNKTNVFI